MAGHEQVVIAFVGVGIAHQSALGANRVKFVVSTGDQFVRIDLMAGIPDQTIVQKVVRAVQSQRQFDDAQVRGEVGGPQAEQVAKRFTNLVGNLIQLLQRHVVKLKRRLNGGQQFGHGLLSPVYDESGK